MTGDALRGSPERKLAYREARAPAPPPDLEVSLSSSFVTLSPTPYQQQAQARAVNDAAPHRAEASSPVVPARHQEGLYFATPTSAQWKPKICTFDGTKMYRGLRSGFYD